MINYNLYTKEIKRNRKNLITWSLIVIGFTFLILAIFPSMADMGDDITKMMDKLPEEVGKALGMDSQTWSSITGFYSTYYGIYIILLVGIFTTSTGATIISKEEKDGTSEFLMTKPISRKTIFMTKMMSLLTLTLIIYAVQTIFAIIGFASFGGGKVDWIGFAIMHTHGLALILFFTTTGVLLSMFFKPKKNFMGMVVGIIFGSYFLDAMSKAASSVEWLGYISPFHYLDFAVTSDNYSVNIFGASTMVALGVGLLFFAFKTYSKRDING
jgi:ABC-2 type transport system permease protein